MAKTTLFLLAAAGILAMSSPVWAQSTTTTSGGQMPMTNSNDPASNGAMQNGAMQQAMPLSPSANGSGTLKSSAEANKQRMMMQQNTGQ